MKTAKQTQASAFTPGPWIYAYGAVYQGPDIDSLTNESANRLMLADRSNPLTTPCERDANARLCAAAPDLLRCLTHLEAELQRAFDEVPAGVDAWMSEARAAIALACPDTPAHQRIP